MVWAIIEDIEIVESMFYHKLVNIFTKFQLYSYNKSEKRLELAL